MTILNKYTKKKTKTFTLRLTDDNGVIEVVKHEYGNRMDIYVCEDPDGEKHINKFKFVNAGETISRYENWFYICRVGDEFLFQKSSWEH